MMNDIAVLLSQLPQRALQAAKENRKFIARLRKLNPGNLDVEVKALHQKVFETIDCLQCANCCRSISPAITDKDIEKIAKHLKMRPAVFIEKYLHVDSDHDYVFNAAPCPLLSDDNRCSIYESRPEACAGYPHTDRKHFIQLLDLTLKNTFVCPAAFEIVERLKKSFVIGH